MRSAARLFPAILAASLALSACQSPGYFYEKSSGLRVDSSPDLLARFQEQKLQCDAESAKAALTSQERDVFIHNRNVTLIYHACMARQGYVVRDR